MHCGYFSIGSHVGISRENLKSFANFTGDLDGLFLQPHLDSFSDRLINIYLCLRFIPDPLFDIWLQDGGTEMCNNDIGIKKRVERAGKTKIKISGRAEILLRKP